MKWLPYENFYIDTNLKPDAAVAAPAQEVSSDTGFSFTTMFSQRSDSYFLGSFENDNFRIKGQVYNRNSFLPILKMIQNE
jgi:hypothetical protein